jgi:hypothetical protein
MDKLLCVGGPMGVRVPDAEDVDAIALLIANYKGKHSGT